MGHRGVGEAREPDLTETEVDAVGKADELFEGDPLDASHPFLMISRALRGIVAESVADEDLGEIIPAEDQLSLALQ